MAPKPSLWSWLRSLIGGAPAAPAAPVRSAAPTGDQEARALAEFSKHFGVTFHDPALLKLALTHRSYLSVTGQGPQESNERLEFLGDSVLGLVTSEHLYRAHPDEHEGQLTKTKSLLVSKAILSRRALAMGLGRFVLMSHSEVESGGRQRLSIIADGFESVIGAIYLDQGFEAARAWITHWLLEGADEIMADKRHVNYKSHLQEYVQSTFRTHPVYRIRSEMGPDHSKHFNVEVMVGRRLLGEGKGRNKKEAEQAAARDALDRVGGRETRRPAREAEEPSVRAPRSPLAEPPPAMVTDDSEAAPEEGARRRRGRRGGRGRRGPEGEERELPAAAAPEAERAPERARPAPRAERRPEREPAVRAEPAPHRESVGPFALPREDGRFERMRIEAEKAADDLEVVDVGEDTRDFDDEDFEEVGRPEGPLGERVDPYAWERERDDDDEPELVSPHEVLEPEDVEPRSAERIEDEEEGAFEAEGDVVPHRPEPERNAERVTVSKEPWDSDEADLPQPARAPAPSPEPAPAGFGRRRARRR